CAPRSEGAHSCWGPPPLGGERLSLQNLPGGERPSCNRCAEPYHTTSLRRLPARRPKVVPAPPSSRTTIRIPDPVDPEWAGDRRTGGPGRRLRFESRLSGQLLVG